MRLVPLIIALAVQVSLVLSLPLAKGNVDYYDPRLNSGSMLDSASRDKHGNIVGEPLNVSALIIAGLGVC
jgi:hypothetical protein